MYIWIGLCWNLSPLLCSVAPMTYNLIFFFFLGRAFFTSLYRCLTNGARAVFQLYPENIHQRELILNAAMRAGFAGGIVVDYPHRFEQILHKASFIS